eukprot:1156828-Pelagomonas_calceolata.AAC.6
MMLFQRKGHQTVDCSKYGQQAQPSEGHISRKPGFTHAPTHPPPELKDARLVSFPFLFLPHINASAEHP